MNLMRVAEYAVRLSHRHEDGSIAAFEPVVSHHSSADHDPERDWANGTIYRCTSCDEEVMVSPHEESQGPRT